MYIHIHTYTYTHTYKINRQSLMVLQHQDVGITPTNANSVPKKGSNYNAFLRPPFESIFCTAGFTSHGLHAHLNTLPSVAPGTFTAPNSAARIRMLTESKARTARHCTRVERFIYFISTCTTSLSVVRKGA